MKLQVLMEAMKMTREVTFLNFQYKGEHYQIRQLQFSHSFVIYKGYSEKDVFDTITYK